MKHVVDFQSEQDLVQQRWSNIKKIPGASKLVDLNLDGGDPYYEINPKADASITVSASANAGYVNPFT